MTKRKVDSQRVNRAKMFLVTTLSAGLVAVVLLIILALLLDKIGLSEKQVQIGIYIVYLASGMASGLFAGKWQREKKFMWGALAGSIWFLIMLIISLSINHMSIDASGLFPAVVCMIGGGMLGGMLA